MASPASPSSGDTKDCPTSSYEELSNTQIGRNSMVAIAMETGKDSESVGSDGSNNSKAENELKKSINQLENEKMPNNTTKLNRKRTISPCYVSESNIDENEKKVKCTIRRQEASTSSNGTRSPRSKRKSVKRAKYDDSFAENELKKNINHLKKRIKQLQKSFNQLKNEKRPNITKKFGRKRTTKSCYVSESNIDDKEKKVKCTIRRQEASSSANETPLSLPKRRSVKPAKYDDFMMESPPKRRNASNVEEEEPENEGSDGNIKTEHAIPKSSRKTSTRNTTKLSQVIEVETLGYCCGIKYTFTPQPLCCYGKKLCTISRDAKYFVYQDKYTYCQKCFNEIPGETVSLELEEDEPTAPSASIGKDQFIEKKNDHLELEPIVECYACGRKFHQICVLYMENIWPQGFTCENCLKAKNQDKEENKFTAKRMPTTKLGTYIETRVNNFLKKKEAGAGEVYIRVVSTCEKVVEVKSGMRQRYVETGSLNDNFPYRAKAIFAFEEIDGTDVCFFGMHVQEYGSECPAPNTRRVYISYLDSVNFFRPREFRTAVYHEIVLGYLEYAKQLGYTMAHVMACPPSEGDGGYIFHCHPPEQKVPEPKRLQEWYKKMLDHGIVERIVLEYKDILMQAMEDNLSSAAGLPYFEGDFWPDELEKLIKEVDQEEEEKRRQAEAAAEAAAAAAAASIVSQENVDGKTKGQKKAKKSNKSKANQRKNNKKSNAAQTCNDLLTKIFATMEIQKEMFFVIRLHSAQAAASLASIQDPDPLIACELMDTRDDFFTFARERYFEFSSLRRAKYSTMWMLFELHNKEEEMYEYEYTCNNCEAHVKTRFHCTVCEEFDLCTPCFRNNGHEHKMYAIGFDLDDGSSLSAGG